MKDFNTSKETGIKAVSNNIEKLLNDARELPNDIKDQIARYERVNPAAVIIYTVLIGSVVASVLGAIFL